MRPGANDVRRTDLRSNGDPHRQGSVNGFRLKKELNSIVSPSNHNKAENDIMPPLLEAWEPIMQSILLTELSLSKLDGL